MTGETNDDAQHPVEGEVIVTGGGTAGHVLPAIAVGRALVAGGRDRASICYVGAANGLEAKLVPEAGFGLVLLPGRGIQRRITAENLGAGAGLAVATARAFRLVAEHRPVAVVTVGGYAGVPCALAALALGVPVVVVNVDAVPGAANRLVGRFARASAVALPGTALPRAVLTGAPVRPEVLEVERTPEGRARARRVLGLDEGRLVVAVTGGSLGARRLNEASLGLARLLAERGDLTLYHVTGERDHDMVLAARARLSSRPGAGLDYRVVAYEQHMPELLAASDVVICRAGASTVAELTVIGTPSVLVPLPGAPADHQRRNAEVLAAAGAGVLVPDAEATSDRLVTELEALLADPRRLERMERSALALGRRDAAVRVAALVEEIARRPGARRRVGRVLARHGGRSAPGSEVAGDGGAEGAAP